MSIKHRLLIVVLILSGCTAPRPEPAPRPVPVPVRPAPAPVPQPMPAPAATDWQDLPLSRGSWTFSETGQRVEAAFGAGMPSFLVRCDRATRQVQLLRPGITSGNVMVVRTTEASRSLPVSIAQDQAATPFVTLAAADPLLDNIAFSRGRVGIELVGLPTLIVPAWAEPARVIDACRG